MSAERTFITAPTDVLDAVYDATTADMDMEVLAGYEGEGPDARAYAAAIDARPRRRAPSRDNDAEAWA